MVVVLVVVSVVCWLIGLVQLSGATFGVGALVAACYFVILARLEQSTRQHKQLIAAIEALKAPTP